MRIQVVTLMLFATLLTACGKTDATDSVLDVTGVTAISITGTASSIKLSTKDGIPYQASVTARRTGWFAHWYSSWSFNDCPATAKMRVENATLYVDVAPVSWPDLSDCVTEISANVKKEAAVSINQAAFQAKLSGDFSAVTIAGRAGDIRFDGHATTIAVQGEAVAARVVFERVAQDEAIDIAAKELDAYLSFGKSTPISYTVVAKASWVDSALPNTPGVKPLVSIKGEFVHATIR